MTSAPRPDPPLPAPSPGGWSLAAILSFGAILLLLTVVGVVGMMHRPPAPRGLPEDAAIEAARAAIRGHLDVDAGELRFETAFDSIALAAGPELERDRGKGLAEAGRRLREARVRHPRDARIETLLGHVELAGQRLERAERHYRAAAAREPRYGEARLGLGVALARRADTQGDPAVARRLRLEAIAQLAAVEEGDPLYLPALFDRILLLSAVGRMDEARHWTKRYVELEPGSPWSAMLMRRSSAASP